MPSTKMKTHKGVKKRFKVSATGKVSHKRCGSSHLNSHKSGSKIRRLRKKSYLKIGVVARKHRLVLGARANVAERVVQDAAPPESTAAPDVTPTTE